MPRYYIVHYDSDNVPHQLRGAWNAISPQHAIARMLKEAREDDDGKWEAFEVTKPSDIIR
jgi:hypothetical protein